MKFKLFFVCLGHAHDEQNPIVSPHGVRACKDRSKILTKYIELATDGKKRFDHVVTPEQIRNMHTAMAIADVLPQDMFEFDSQDPSRTFQCCGSRGHKFEELRDRLCQSLSALKVRNGDTVAVLGHAHCFGEWFTGDGTSLRQVGGGGCYVADATLRWMWDREYDGKYHEFREHQWAPDGRWTGRVPATVELDLEPQDVAGPDRTFRGERVTGLQEDRLVHMHQVLTSTSRRVHNQSAKERVREMWNLTFIRETPSNFEERADQIRQKMSDFGTFGPCSTAEWMASVGLDALRLLLEQMARMPMEVANENLRRGQGYEDQRRRVQIAISIFRDVCRDIVTNAGSGLHADDVLRLIRDDIVDRGIHILHDVPVTEICFGEFANPNGVGSHPCVLVKGRRGEDVKISLINEDDSAEASTTGWFRGETPSRLSRDGQRMKMMGYPYEFQFSFRCEYFCMIVKCVCRHLGFLAGTIEFAHVHDERMPYHRYAGPAGV